MSNEVCAVKPKGEIDEALDFLDIVIERARDKFNYLADEIENVCHPSEPSSYTAPDEAPHSSVVGRRIQTARKNLEQLCADIDTLRGRHTL